MTEEDFLQLDDIDRMKFRAVCNCVTTLGEAVKNWSPEIFAKNSSIDFAGYAGMKDIFTHQYFRRDHSFFYSNILIINNLI